MHSVPYTSPSSTLKSSNNRYVIFAVCRVFLDCSVHVFNVVARISRVGDALVVYHDCGSDGSFVDVLGIGIFCRHFLFSIIPTPCSLSYFPAPMNMCLWCVSKISDLSGLHVSLINIASHL